MLQISVVTLKSGNGIRSRCRSARTLLCTQELNTWHVFSALTASRTGSTCLSRPSRLFAVAAFCEASTPLSRSRPVTFLAMSRNVHGSASGADCWNREARLSKLSSPGCVEAQ